jgi:GTP cyclohydrolase I
VATRDRDAAARAVRDLLRALGHEPEGALASTPALVAEAWIDELLSGEDVDPVALLSAARIDRSAPAGAPGQAEASHEREGEEPEASDEPLGEEPETSDEPLGEEPETSEVVVLRDLSVAMMCPHHLLPSHGFGDVALVPRRHVAGLGAVARALDACTRRLTLQEDAGAHMAAALLRALDARGALCRLRLTHTCLSSRGARESTATVETISFAGEGAARALALAALGGVPPMTPAAAGGDAWLAAHRARSRG